MKHFLDLTGLERFLTRLKEIFVQTINGIAADDSGEVTLSAGDVGAASTEEMEAKANVSEVTALTERIATNETKYANMSATVSEVKTEQGQFNSTVTKLESGLSNTQSDVSALGTRVDTLEEKAKETYKDVLTVTDESTTLSNREKTSAIMFGAEKAVVTMGSGSVSMTEDGVTLDTLTANEVRLGNLKFSVGVTNNVIKGQWVEG